MSFGRRILFAIVVLSVGACQEKKDPERYKLMQRLRDARPAARIVAIQKLAPNANREETAAIVRAAEDASADVRRVVALSLAKVAPENAVDFAAAMLRDPSDEVRAAAVSTLAARGGARGLSYLAHAYASGGPSMRAAVLNVGPEVLSQAVLAESKSWMSGLERRKKAQLETVQGDAIEELGFIATPEALAELRTRLADPKPALAAAACLGLARAGDSSAIPQIREAMRGGRAVVTQGCAFALAALDPANAADAIAPLLASSEAAFGLIASLESVELSAAAREKVCALARSAPDASVALRAAQLVGDSCPGKEPKGEGWSPVQTMQILTALKQKSPAVLKQAREWLASASAEEAIAAASYLAVAGTSKDGALLVNAAVGEAQALESARNDAESLERQKREIAQHQRTQEEEVLQRILGPKYDLLRKKRPKSSAEVLSRLNKTNGPDVSDIFEHRPGAVAFIQAATAAAAQLKADVRPVAEALYGHSEPRLRHLVIELAEFVGEQGVLLRERLRTSTDVDYRVGQLLNDVRAGRDGAVEQALEVSSLGNDLDRAELAALLAPVADEYRATLVRMAERTDSSLPAVIQALSNVSDATVDQLLMKTLRDPKGLGAVEAIVALAKRTDPHTEAALKEAAVHPLPDVRAAALQALAARKACTSAPALQGLAGDYVGVVRAASDMLQSSCRQGVAVP